MTPPRFILTSALALFPLLAARAGEADDALLQAAAKGDAPRIVLALSEADPDTRDADGRTPLMLAARAGDFESVRRLLWGKANATLRDPQGKTARDFLDLNGRAFAPLALILRCYSFCHEYGRPGGKARIPNLTLVNDLWVDPSHPKLRPLYVINQAELNGKPGVDDDKNGFVDDVYGWNIHSNEPLRAPLLSIDSSAETHAYLAQLLKDYDAATSGGDEKLASILQNRYKNPLVRQIGYDTFSGVDIDLNDYAYAAMLHSASHGTHVAGIVASYSEGKAKLAAATLGSTAPTTDRVFDDLESIAKLAEKTPDYAQFVTAVLDRYRGQAIAQGRRASDYLRVSGAGVANMSWTWPRSIHEAIAKQLAEIYEKHGPNPDSIQNPASTADALIISNLPLELTVAQAAASALAFYESPDVLFVIAAGNEHENNDDLLPSPQYLSRFFPNVITVASVNADGVPSSFSNYGVRSVQLAALGERVVSTMLAGLECPMDGTSMASPVVAGTAAGIRADFPHLSAADVRSVLEASVKKSDDLKNLVATSGVLNPKAAHLMASLWSKNNPNRLANDARLAQLPGRDGPQLNVPVLASGGRKKSTAEKSGPPRRVTGVTGYGKTWRALMSRGSGFDQQRLLGVGDWPNDAIQEGWNDGLMITSVAGEPGSWNVVMSGGVPGNQSIFGLTLNQDDIAKAMADGFRITTVAGWKDSWAVVMNTETKLGAQRYTLPTPLTDSRKDWIQKRFAEGFRITAVGGDDAPDHDDDGWFFVASKNSGLGDQRISEPGPWPADWIAELSAEGYAVTAASGHGDHTLVVMSKGSKLKEQDFSDEGLYPASWIQEHW
jgi:hypothetical protein